MSQIYLTFNNIPIFNGTLVGWIIEQLPKSVRMSITDKSASFTYSILANGNQIQLAFRLLINKPVYIQTEYEELKSFFDELVKKQNEMIVLKKA
jgi:hypothetical protein